MKDQFEMSCERVGIRYVIVKTSVTEDVYDYLLEMADKNECSLRELLRYMIDYLIENDAD